jgi:undecaprenyl diphosphate synthase
LSNFLLYQVAHTELVVTQTFWPDFGREAFAAAIAEYQRRMYRAEGA